MAMHSSSIGAKIMGEKLFDLLYAHYMLVGPGGEGDSPPDSGLYAAGTPALRSDDILKPRRYKMDLSLSVIHAVVKAWENALAGILITTNVALPTKPERKIAAKYRGVIFSLATRHVRTMTAARVEI